MLSFFWLEHLQRDDFTELEVLCLEDLAEPTVTDAPADPVTTSDQ